MMPPLAVKDALLVIDVQNDFVDGSVAIAGAAAIVPVINRLSRRFHHVVFTKDWHPPGHVSFASSHAGARPGDQIEQADVTQLLFADHCVRGTHGAELHDGLDLNPAHLLLHKGCRPDVDSFSAFIENDGSTRTGLHGYLRERGVGRVFIVGLALYGCVRHTALDARRAGLETVVIDDACRGRPSPHIDAMSMQMAEAGVRRIDSSLLGAAD